MSLVRTERIMPAAQALAIGQEFPACDRHGPTNYPRADKHEIFLQSHVMMEPSVVAGIAARARAYAAEVLQTVAVCDRETMLVTAYQPGHFCDEHIDQYFGRTIPDTGHRTVSVSLILERAEKGGEMVFQDYRRVQPPAAVNPEPGCLIFFPADWWHQVLEIEAGVRRSTVQWFHDPSGQVFHSHRLLT